MLCTDLDADPGRIVCWFVRRWQVEATSFQEARQHLGGSKPRAALVGVGDPEERPGAAGPVFSVVALLAHQHMAKGEGVARKAAWYAKTLPTFSDALALVGRKLLSSQGATFCGSVREDETVKVLRKYIERLTDAVCYAA